MDDRGPSFPLDGWLRTDRLAHIWCCGCGLGIILNCLARALDRLDFDLDRLVMVSGIGCAGRAAGYVRCDGFHATHGRAIPLATGAKIANPDLAVVILSGDGDLFGIGGNHFLHAARRNVEMLVICANNFNYGMTGGQVGPTTPVGARTHTTPLGNIEEPLNLVAVAAAAGASYVARWSVNYVQKLTHSIETGLCWDGLAFIEVISPCPPVYGEMNNLGVATEMLEALEAVSRISQGLSPYEAVCDPNQRIVCGEFVRQPRPGYTGRLAQLVQQAQRGARPDAH